eukprot:5258224-Alexandrium_andersonii.AAC.1
MAMLVSESFNGFPNVAIPPEPPAEPSVPLQAGKALESSMDGRIVESNPDGTRNAQGKQKRERLRTR